MSEPIGYEQSVAGVYEWASGLRDGRGVPYLRSVTTPYLLFHSWLAEAPRPPSTGPTQRLDQCMACHRHSPEDSTFCIWCGERL